MLAIAVLALFYRRPGQFLYPYIWDEDGSIILRDYIEQGFTSISAPVSGYLIIIPKLINFLAFKISFWYYPEIASFFANAFCIGVIFAIAYSPTYLRKPWLCAVLTLFVKTDAECFGTTLYSFWWAGLLLILVTLWDTEQKPVWCIIYLLLGGLSSPIILIAVPILAVRAICERNKWAISVFAISLIPFSIQARLMFRGFNSNTAELARKVISTYFGRSLFGAYLPDGKWNLVLGFFVVVALSMFGIIYFVKLIKNFPAEKMTYFILCAWGAGVILSMSERNWFIGNPINAAPRYFFYPFIIISWLLVFFFDEYKKLAVRIPLLILMFSFVFDGTLPYMTRNHFPINWRSELVGAFTGYGNYKLPIHFDGVNEPWYLDISPQDCEKLISNSLFFRESVHNAVQTPDIFNDTSKEKPGIVCTSNIDGLTAEIENNRFMIQTWAFDYTAKKPVSMACAEINGVLYYATYGRARPDVAEYVQDNDALYTGLAQWYGLQLLNEGKNTLRLKFLSHDKSFYTTTSDTLIIERKGDELNMELE